MRELHLAVAAPLMQHIEVADAVRLQDHTLAAIEWARKEGHRPLVAGVRNLNDKKTPITGVRRERDSGPVFQHILSDRMHQRWS
jgi:hypothetical protein